MPLNPPNCSRHVGVQFTRRRHYRVVAKVVSLHLTSARTAIPRIHVPVVAGLISRQERIPALSHTIEGGIVVVCSRADAVPTAEDVVEGGIATGAGDYASQVSSTDAALDEGAVTGDQIPRSAVAKVAGVESVPRQTGGADSHRGASVAPGNVVLAGVAQTNANINVARVAGTGLAAVVQSPVISVLATGAVLGQSSQSAGQTGVVAGLAVAGRRAQSLHR